MFVITAKVKSIYENVTMTVFAGRDWDSYGSGEPCWCGDRNTNIKYFCTSKQAEAWFNAEKNWLLSSHLEVQDIAIAEISYTNIKNLQY